jgi:FlaA1/EpsC-like NDP-sugar epimerase
MILKLRYLTLLLDYFLLQGMFVLAYLLRVGFVWSSDFPFEPYFWTSLAAGLVWLASLLIFRGYNPSIRFTRWIHIMKVIVAGLTGTALFGLIFYFGQQSLFSRLLLGYIFCLGTVGMLLFHLLMQWIENTLIRKGHGNIRTLIIGSNRGVKAFIAELKKNHSPYVPVAVLDGYGTKQKEIHGVPVLGKLNILEETVDEYDIHAIVQGDNVEQVVNIVHFCDKNQLDYFLLPYLLGMYQDSLRVQMIEKPVIAPARPGGRSWTEKLLS